MKSYAFVAVAALAGCASSPAARVAVEDQARRAAPIPCCVLPLPAHGPRSQGTLRGLHETEVAKLLVPTFDEASRRMPEGAPTCVGAISQAAGGNPVRAEGRLEDGDVLFGAAPDRIKVVWLRARDFGDGTVGGPIALVRGREDLAEAYAVGGYRGRRDHVTLGATRAGAHLVVTAEDDGCSGSPHGAACETTLSVFVARRGRLERVVDASTLRIAPGVGGERGVAGSVEYRLSSAPSYGADGIHIAEQLEVRTSAGEVVRKVERDRAFVFDPRGDLRPSSPSLWDETGQKL